MKQLLSILAVCACVSGAAFAQVSAPSLKDFEALGPLDVIEKLGETPLNWRSKNGWIEVTYNGSFVFEGYVIDTRAPGLIMENDPFFYYKDTNIGRLSVGEHLMFFVNLQDDRGFDPDNQGFRSELVAYFVRATPFDEPWVNLQAGKFATVVGNFVPRHGTFENPFVRDPLPYDFMTVLGNGPPAPNATALLNRRNIPDRKQRWIPMVWGPVYHTGVEAFGAVEKFEYAFCVANAALSTPPNQWDLDSQNDEHFNYEARVGYEPIIGLKLGASYALGPYLKKSRFDDMDQQTFGFDAAYSIGHWQFWSEFFATEWEAPNISDELRAYSYYVETRYKFTPGFYGSLRWGQIFFNEIEKANGNDTRWDRDAWRIEAGLGYFIRKNIVTRIQYEHNHQNGDLQQGANMLSLQLALGM
jgi:hypothetical protein